MIGDASVGVKHHFADGRSGRMCRNWKQAREKVCSFCRVRTAVRADQYRPHAALLSLSVALSPADKLHLLSSHDPTLTASHSDSIKLRTWISARALREFYMRSNLSELQCFILKSNSFERKTVQGKALCLQFWNWTDDEIEKYSG